MMIFKGINNQTVDLKIVDYQFPGINDGDWDGNWLLIYLNVNSDLGDWQTTDPSLTTWDVQSLIVWFQIILNDIIPDENPCEFLEPNLKFLFIPTEDSKKRISIKFDLESKPKSADNETKYYVHCEWTNEELRQIINDLRIELSKFPERKAKL